MNYEQKIYNSINEIRAIRGFLSIEDTLDLRSTGNQILDPFSVLISKNAKIGSNNIFYPNVIIENDCYSPIIIGNNNILSSQSIIVGANGGNITIGNSNLFEGAVTVRANLSASKIMIGDNGRYLNGVQILGCSTLGSGSQVIGNITLYDCILEAGESFCHNDPDLRGGVVKGMGEARGLHIKVGEVIKGLGQFDLHDVKRQSFYHPKKENLK